MLQSELIPPVWEEAPQAFRRVPEPQAGVSPRAGFSSVTFMCSHVFVHAQASVYVILSKHAVSNRRENKQSGVASESGQLGEGFRSKSLMMLILAECGGRVFLQTAWGGGWGGGSLLTETASILSLCAVIATSDDVSLVAV